MQHICIVICTCDRHHLLGDLLSALMPQLKEANAALVVTDNGSEAATAVVEPYRDVIDILYLRLKERGLVAARNAGLAAARETRAAFIAFIDDDEVPEPHWLENLSKALSASGADIACGPYVPEFLIEPPSWAAASHFYSKDGTSIATGNIMFRATLLPADSSDWFQPAFAFTGGEDEEFFSRLIAKGARFTTATNAVVRERIPASRLRLSYIFRTGIRDGIIETEIARQGKSGFVRRLALHSSHAVKKTAFAANHIFWCWKEPWRGIAALRDMSEVLGTVIGAAGFTGRFYGPN